MLIDLSIKQSLTTDTKCISSTTLGMAGGDGRKGKMFGHNLGYIHINNYSTITQK